MPTGLKLIKKNAYMAKLVDLVENTDTALIIDVTHVGSKQMQNIRLALRGAAIVLMGKNTMIRKALRLRIEARLAEDENADVTALNNLLAAVNGNIGFIFCQQPGSLEKARKAIEEYVVPAAARGGVIAPKDVIVPAGPTSLEPSQTSFFQVLNIPTKIVKGAIEMTAESKVCTAGQKVSLGGAALLGKLGIKPFQYGMRIVSAFQDGTVFAAEVLDIDDATLISKFMTGVNHVAAFGREIGVPTECGLPHMMTKAFKNIVAAVVDVDFNAGEKVQEIKDILSDPEKLAAMKAASSAGPAVKAAGGSAPAAAAAAAPEEEEEEEGMDFDLFG